MILKYLLIEWKQTIGYHFMVCNFLKLRFWLKDVNDVFHKRNLDKQQGFICIVCKRHY